MILAYIDDFLITGDDLGSIEELKANLQSTLKVKELGYIRYFLSLEFAKTPSGLYVGQHKYISTSLLPMTWKLANLQ